MEIRIDDLSSAAVADLLTEHLHDMYAASPPESVHALDLTKLRKPEISFWCVWEGTELMGCGALKELTPQHAEIKSMRSANRFRGCGVGKAMLQHILQVAHQRDYTRLSLETGTQDFFIPARKLYESFGFEYCGPFGDYKEDLYSAFMTKAIV
uniref:GNAT family N-acetyltransferase n=1 Tax=Cellvibrio fontiphilus TaxID=1815559 RepID=UPI002B4BC23E|nr:GNAT family N-acetyltransferase [Cellvibrio fontiphilus]